MAKADKATAVADIAEQFKASTATLVTEYRGLTVANMAELRRLGDSATYSVAKNTLVKRAASEAGVEGLDELFVGPTAIAFVKGEAVDAAKAIKTFAKDHRSARHQGRLHGRPCPFGRRGRADRRPGVARGAAGQAGRRDEGNLTKAAGFSTLPHRSSPVWSPRCKRRPLRKLRRSLLKTPH